MWRRSTGNKVVIYALMALVMIFFLGPIFWFILLAFRHPSEAYNLPPQLFFEPYFGNFGDTFVDPGKNAPQLVNSLIVSSGATLLSLPFALAAAYALSRFAMRGKDFIMNWYISLLIAPPIVFVIPVLRLDVAHWLVGHLSGDDRDAADAGDSRLGVAAEELHGRGAA